MKISFDLKIKDQMTTIQQLFTVWAIDIERRKNRLLKFCYVPATSAAHNRLLFFFYSTNEPNKAGLKQSIFLEVYGLELQCKTFYRCNFMRA